MILHRFKVFLRPLVVIKSKPHRRRHVFGARPLDYTGKRLTNYPIPGRALQQLIQVNALGGR